MPYLMRTKPRPFLYLPSDYKTRTHKVVTGIAESGEMSEKGTVTHTETWDDRVAVDAAPAGIRYLREPDGTIRPLTFQEQVDRGYFIVGRGPIGVRG